MRWPRHAFGELAVTMDAAGSTCQRERREGSGRGLAGLLRAARRAVVGDWAGPLAGLVASRAGFSLFFLKPFPFSFLVFEELEKKGFRLGIFMKIIFIK